MDYESKSTTPKPFVFVLMPIDEKFNDIYKFGIKGAAEDAGAYAERVDEQIFTEGILERIFNQINKADVIVADMTGRNANVFYEVGYAHALGKIVLLLTQSADDIPFDLKHKQHIVYGGKIETLRSKLTERIVWAVSESGRKRKQNLLERLLVSLPEVEIPEANSSNNMPIIEINYENGKIRLFPIPIIEDVNKLILTFSIRNLSPEITNISFIYFFTTGRIVASEKLDDENRSWRPLIGIDNFNSTNGLSKQFKVYHNIPPLPSEAVEQLRVEIGYFEEILDELFKLRIHTSSGNFHDFPFRIKVDIRRDNK